MLRSSGPTIVLPQAGPNQSMVESRSSGAVSLRYTSKAFRVRLTQELSERSNAHNSGLAEAKRQWSALHDVVGHDGVLVIYLERAERHEYTELNKVGIYPKTFPAVDALTASPDELSQGCYPKQNDSHRCKGPGEGCRKPVIQAIAESHRQALLAARERNSTWTAILEDDAVPVDPVHFNRNFKEVWSRVPEGVGIVRLSWCPLLRKDRFDKHTYFAYDSFRLVDSLTNHRNGRYWTGGCTTGYMVHHDFIPTVLSIFPCCAALDACLDLELFHSPLACNEDNKTKCWGQEHMMGLDIQDSGSKTRPWRKLLQNGILAQDNRVSKSTHPSSK